eukprot:2884841-Prymnesium_polylepis.1
MGAPSSAAASAGIRGQPRWMSVVPNEVPAFGICSQCTRWRGRGGALADGSGRPTARQRSAGPGRASRRAALNGVGAMFAQGTPAGAATPNGPCTSSQYPRRGR